MNTAQKAKHQRLLADREDIKLGHWKHILGALITSGLWLVPYLFMYLNYKIKKSSIDAQLEELENKNEF